MNIESLSALADKNIQVSDKALKDFKAGSLSRFKTQGFHSPVVDGYKFTNLETFFGSLEKLEEQKSDASFPQTDFPTLVFQDGELVRSDKLPSGITLKSLKDNFSQVKDLLTESNALSQLHHSLVKDGVIIEIAKNQEIETPLRILNLLTSSSISAPTHLIVAHAHSKVTVIEETIGKEVAHATINESYIYAHKGAVVEHIYLDEESSLGLNHSSLSAEVEQDATVRTFIFHNQGKMNRKNLTLNLNAPGSNGESYSLFLTNGKEHSDINTVIHHKAADTTSRQIAKGILDGESKGIFTGKIHIHPQAQRVASSQLNKNLLLSKKAQVHSQPQLEIFADDVKCSHGSTTGQLSDEEVFYFQARGIPEDKARVLLAQGFGLEVVLKIENKAARAHVNDVILKNLQNKFNLGGLS